MENLNPIRHLNDVVIQPLYMFKNSIFDKDQQKFSFVRQEILKNIPIHLRQYYQTSTGLLSTCSEIFLFDIHEDEPDWSQYAELAVVFELIDLSFGMHRSVVDGGDLNLQTGEIAQRNSARILLGDFLLTEASKRSLQFEDMAIQACIARFMRNLSEASLLFLTFADGNGGKASLPLALVRKLRICAEAAISAKRHIAGSSATKSAYALLHLFTTLFIMRLEQGMIAEATGRRSTIDDDPVAAKPELLSCSSGTSVLERRLIRAHAAQSVDASRDASTFPLEGA